MVRKKRRRRPIIITFAHPGPVSVSNNPAVNAAWFEVWRQVPSVFNSVTLDFGHGPVTITTKWEPVIPEVLRGEEWIAALYSGSKARIEGVVDHYKKTSIRKHSLKIYIDTGVKDYVGDHNVAEMYLYTLFVVMNIAAPGAVELSRVTIGTGRVITFDMFSYTLGLAWEWSIQKGWPPIQRLDLSQVLEWVSRADIHRYQVARTRESRALYSLLHLCAIRSIPGPAAIFWLAYGLEALVESPVERITSALKRRLFLLLGTPTDHRRVGKLLSEFYDFRSRIVHGEFSVLHPANNDILDSAVEDYHQRFDEPVLFATAVVTAALQELVRRGWRTYSFVEQLSTENI